MQPNFTTSTKTHQTSQRQRSTSRRGQPSDEQTAKAAERRLKFRQMVSLISAMSLDERQAMVNRIGAVLTCEGRAVQKGEHGLMIWVPIQRGTEADGSEEGDGESEVNFLMATIFDITQTVEIATAEAA